MNQSWSGETRGRKAKSYTNAATQQVIDAAAPRAAAILRDVVTGTRKKISFTRQRACEFIIEHAIGRPTQKVQMKHTGQPITYQELAEGADRIIKAAHEAGKTTDDVLKEAEAVAARAEQELNQTTDADQVTGAGQDQDAGPVVEPEQ